MGKSNGRDLYFEKHIKSQPTAEQYLNALEKSPYTTHKRMSILLKEKYNEIVNSKEQTA